MPPHIVPLPVTASNHKLHQRGETINLVSGVDTFNRVGEDGNIPIIPLNGGDEFQTTLEGHWHKGRDANISTPTATTSGGTLRMTGVASVAGTAGNDWINSYHPVPFLDELEVTVSMEVPVDDTGATADRDIRYSFFLKQDKDELQPDNDNNFLEIRTDVDENGLILQLYKEVNTVNTLLASGYDYTMDTTRSTGNLEATIWRLVFNGKPGVVGSTLSVYLKQAATLALAESATENQITGSPFDISDLAFNIGYPSYRLYTQNTTYCGTTYDSANRCASTYLRIDYPEIFKTAYNFTEANYGETDVKIYDGTPSASSRIYDEDHEFSSDCYIDNGLIRLQIDELTQYGLIVSAYYSAAWNQILNRVYYYAVTSAQSLTYPTLRNIEYISPEEAQVKIRLLDSSTVNTDYYMDILITVKRGLPYLKIETLKVYPLQDTRFNCYPSTTLRFGYAGDKTIGDDDLNITGNNTTLSDNFLVAFDDTGGIVIVTVFTDEKPAGGNTRFQASDGGDLIIEDIDHTEALSTVTWIGVSPYTNIANLFEEAEAMVKGGLVTDVADPLASGGIACLLNAANEFVRWEFDADDLAAGRYLWVSRIRDINQVAGDVSMRAFNNTDSENRGEEGTLVNFTVTATYTYYGLIMSVTDADVSGGDAFQLRTRKDTATANEVYVDYGLLIPLGNGMSWSQDLSHEVMRGIDPRPMLRLR